MDQPLQSFQAFPFVQVAQGYLLMVLALLGTLCHLEDPQKFHAHQVNHQHPVDPYNLLLLERLVDLGNPAYPWVQAPQWAQAYPHLQLPSFHVHRVVLAVLGDYQGPL